MSGESAGGRIQANGSGWSALPNREELLRAWGPLVVAAPVLTFPTFSPLLSLVVILASAGLVIHVERRARRHGDRRTGFDTALAAPLIAVGVLAVLGTVRSPYLSLSIPKLGGVALGLLAFRAVTLTGTTPSAVRALVGTYLAAGTTVVFVGLLSGPMWKGKMWPWIYLADSPIPRILHLPGAEAGVNPNALAGTVLWVLPVLLGLLLSTRSVRAQNAQQRPVFRQWALRLTLASGVIGLLSVMALCQSRTAWLSLLASLLIVASIRSQVMAWSSALAIASLGLAVALLGVPQVLEAVTRGSYWVVSLFVDADQARRWDLAVRAFQVYADDDRGTIWGFAWQALREHPFAGIGLGTFRRVAAAMDIAHVMPTEVPHAHNVFLQVALDLGVAGLLAYVAALVLATRMTWVTLRQLDDRDLRAACLGLWASLLAVHIFGLTDAIALGAKVGLFFWWNLALVAAFSGVTQWGGGGPSFRKAGSTTTY